MGVHRSDDDGLEQPRNGRNGRQRAAGSDRHGETEGRRMCLLFRDFLYQHRSHKGEDTEHCGYDKEIEIATTFL